MGGMGRGRGGGLRALRRWSLLPVASGWTQEQLRLTLQLWEKGDR